MSKAYFRYDSDDNLIGSSDGRSVDKDDETYMTSFTYDAVGNKTSETDPLDHTETWDYTVDTDLAYDDGTVPAGLLFHYREQRGNIDPNNPDDSYTTTYAYYGNGDLAAVSTPSGFETIYTYDELGRLRTEAIIDGPAGIGGLNGRVVATYTYDEVGNVLTVQGPTVHNDVSGEDHRLLTTNHYDLNSNLTSVVESDDTGNDTSIRTTSMTYDNDDRETSVTDPEGGVLQREYDEVGNVTAVIDQNNNRTVTVYDTRNLPTVVKRINFDDGRGNITSEVVISTTTYDAAGRKLTETDAAGRVTKWSYDDADRVKKILRLDVTPFLGPTHDAVLSQTTYDDAGNVLTQKTGVLGNHALVTNLYDEAGRLTMSTLTGTQDVNRLTEFGYDDAGNVTRVARTEGDRTEVTTSHFDEGGRMDWQIVDPGGLALTTRFGYDARGNQVWVRDARSADGTDTQYMTETTYDVLSRPTLVESPLVAVEDSSGNVTQQRPTVTTGYDTFSNATNVLDERNNETVYEFDGLDRVTRIVHPEYTDPDGTVITAPEIFHYDHVGNLDYQISRRNNRTDYRYDGANRVVTQVDPVVSGAQNPGVTEIYYNDAGDKIKTVDQEGGIVEWTYDNMGLVATKTEHVTDATGSHEYVWRYWYDDLGNQTAVEDPSGYIALFSHNGASELTQRYDSSLIAEYEYDVAGRQTKATDALGRYTETTYDLAGRVSRVEQFAPDGAALSHTTYGYDEVGNQTSMVSPRGNETTWDYDELSRLTEVTVPVSDDDPDITTSYGYDAAGNRVRVKDGNDHTTYTSYNVWDLQETIVEPSTPGQTALEDRTWTISYDAGGLPVAESQPGGVEISRVFDELGRMTYEAGIDDGVSTDRSLGYDLTGRLTTVSHPTGTLSYTYDSRGLMLTADGPAGASTVTYDELGRMTTRIDPSSDVPYVFEWTQRSELKKVTDPVSGETIDYVWTAASEVDTVTYENADLTRDYVWDDRGLLESDSLENGAQVGVASTSYMYDLDGNVQSEDVSLPGNAQSGVHSYEYDDAGRLITWSFSNTTVEYGWDGAGNRTSAGGDSYSYDARNRLTSGPDGVYTYTPRGDLATITSGATETTYGFDALGRLVDYNGQVTFTYDGLDRVATRNTVPFTYVGTMLDPASDGTFTYGRSPAGRLVSQTDGTTALLTGLDRHGDLTWLADTSGALTDTVMFDPFGDPTASSGTTDPTVGFQGDYTDPTSGEVWMGARWYSGSDAVFRSRDTYTGELSTPISLNRYTYAWANPNTYWDPDGHRTLFDGAGAAIIGFGDDGTPIREQVSQTRIARSEAVIAASERRLAIQAYYRQLYEAETARPLTASDIFYDSYTLAWIRHGGGFDPDEIIKLTWQFGSLINSENRLQDRPLDSNEVQMFLDLDWEAGTESIAKAMLLAGAPVEVADEFLQNPCRYVICVTDPAYWEITGFGNLQHFVSRFPTSPGEAEYNSIFMAWSSAAAGVRGAPIVFSDPSHALAAEQAQLANMAKYPLFEQSPLGYANDSTATNTAVEGRWAVGDAIDAPTAAGNSPAWSTVRARYWKNEAASAVEGQWTPAQLERMRQGLAPQHPTIEGVSMELDHIVARHLGGGNNIENLRALWPWEHAAVDPYRFYTGPVPGS